MKINYPGVCGTKPAETLLVNIWKRHAVIYAA